METVVFIYWTKTSFTFPSWTVIEFFSRKKLKFQEEEEEENSEKRKQLEMTNNINDSLEKIVVMCCSLCAIHIVRQLYSFKYFEHIKVHKRAIDGQAKEYDTLQFKFHKWLKDLSNILRFLGNFPELNIKEQQFRVFACYSNRTAYIYSLWKFCNSPLWMLKRIGTKQEIFVINADVGVEKNGEKW